MREMGRALLLIACACDGQAEQPPPPARCPDTAIERAPGDCLSVGIQPNGCPAGELLVDGACTPAGAATLCAEGFVADERGGCTPILPEIPCLPGTLAVPGETRCGPLASCGEGPWGAIAVDSSTIYVDATYQTPDADGSAARPFPTIQQGIDAARSGAIVAIAAGSYAEEPRITSRPVVLWGRCPELVEVVGATPAILVGFVDGAVVRGLAVRGGVGVSGSVGTRIEDLWIHDSPQGGVLVIDQVGFGEVAVHNTLVEDVGLVGVLATGSTVTVERSVVRGVTRVSASDGIGLLAQRGPSGTRGAIVLRGSLVERSEYLSAGALGGDLTLEGSLFADGGGIEINPTPDTAEPSTLVVRSAVIARLNAPGLLVQGSDADLEGMVIRHVAADPATTEPRSLVVQNGSAAAVRLSLLDGGAGTGMSVVAASARLEGVAILDMQADATGLRGYGLQIGGVGELARVDVVGSLFAGNHQGGIVVAGGEANLDGILVRDTRPSANGSGQAVHLQAHEARRASVLLRNSWIERSYAGGVVVSDSDLVVEASAVFDTRASPGDSLFGDALAAVDIVGLGTHARVVDSLLAESARAAVSSFGATVSLQGSVLDCNALSLDAETYGKPASFEDLGGNRCGCGTAVQTCKVVSTGIAPPAALE